MDIHSIIDVSSVSFRIARAFCLQRYPLTEEGISLQEEVLIAFQNGQLSSQLIERIPVVENPRPELFADFNLTSEQELEVFGWNLSTIQSHKGCTHQCVQCYKDAWTRLIMMPFAAVCKIARKKRQYEKLAVEEWLAWEKHLKEDAILDARTFLLPGFLRNSRREEIVTLARMILEEWEKFRPRILKVRPFLESMSVKALRRYFLNCVPINFGSILYTTFNYDDCDPLEYRDCLFLHEDGAPADYGDVFERMTTCIRPVTLTTAGWFSEDKVACRAMGKVLGICEKDPDIDSGNHRISVSIWERHFKKDPKRYINEIKRMIREASPLKPLIDFYYDKGDPKHEHLVYLIGADIRRFIMVEKLKSDMLFTPISFAYGRAVELRNGGDYENWDPDGNIDGIHILHDGEVRKKQDSQWTRRRDKKGKIQYHLHAPEGSKPGPTGIWLFQLNS